MDTLLLLFLVSLLGAGDVHTETTGGTIKVTSGT